MPVIILKVCFMSGEDQGSSGDLHSSMYVHPIKGLTSKTSFLSSIMKAKTTTMIKSITVMSIFLL